MIVRGRIRGNGSQLTGYLLKKADNDNIRLLAIIGTSHAGDLRKSLLEMSLTCELTRTDKGLYHAQICPAYGEDKLMTDADWAKAADIWERETGFVGQKRAIVLHEKKGRIHAHVVWERYDHEKGIMKSNKFSRLAQDRARVIMEKEFEHKRTPERNVNRPDMKAYLSEVWGQTKDAHSFMKEVGEKGYVIAAGMQRPYRVIDATGRSFNLVRQLDGIDTKEVRERFKFIMLVKEKEAIDQGRVKQKENAADSRRSLKSAANDNILQITASTKKPTKAAGSYSMQMTFTIGGETPPAAVRMEQEKQAKKQRLLDELREARLQKAKAFRENERDL